MLYRVLVCLTLSVCSVSAWATELPNYPFIHTTGTAFLHAAPDTGEIDFDIKSFDADPEKAAALINARVDEVRALLVANSMAEDQIEVRDMRREMRKDGGTGEEGADQAVYDIVCSVHIEVRRLANWRPMMMGLVAIKNLGNFSTSFSSSQREQLETELTSLALKDAQRRADVIAKTYGRRLGPATAITTGQLKNLTGAIGLQSSGNDTNTDSAPRNQESQDLYMVTTLRMTTSADVIFRMK